VLEHLVIDNEDVSLLILCLFKTGGRIGEVLPLTRNQFETTDDFLYVHNMIVLKKRKTSTVATRREVAIPIGERLNDLFLSLLPTEGKLFDFKYGKAYKMICSLDDGSWFPHRFRAERARQLIRDYKFDALLLQQYFNMEEIDTPLTYARPDLEAVKLKMLTSTSKKTM
jgi:integrase